MSKLPKFTLLIIVMCFLFTKVNLSCDDDIQCGEGKCVSGSCECSDSGLAYGDNCTECANLSKYDKDERKCILNVGYVLLVIAGALALIPIIICILVILIPIGWCLPLVLFSPPALIISFIISIIFFIPSLFFGYKYGNTEKRERLTKIGLVMVIGGFLGIFVVYMLGTNLLIIAFPICFVVICAGLCVFFYSLGILLQKDEQLLDEEDQGVIHPEDEENVEEEDDDSDDDKNYIQHVSNDNLKDDDEVSSIEEVEDQEEEDSDDDDDDDSEESEELEDSPTAESSD